LRSGQQRQQDVHDRLELGLREDLPGQGRLLSEGAIMRDAIISAMLSLTLLITSGCADSGTTTVDIQTEARATASHRPPSIAQRGPSSSPVETPRVSEADTDPEPASLEAEQTELRATITDLELELRLTAEAAEHMGEDFEQAMESI